MIGIGIDIDSCYEWNDMNHNFTLLSSILPDSLIDDWISTHVRRVRLFLFIHVSIVHKLVPKAEHCVCLNWVSLCRLAIQRQILSQSKQSSIQNTTPYHAIEFCDSNEWLNTLA